ncbi:hypothetical protein H0A66_17360 [Alcaligenaceae bacterium]|nr:hypothetical protein [Alcaligenaceae bacterium]
MSKSIRNVLFETRWRAFSGALLLVFLLRAMIAVGYMPSAAPQSGRLGMTLCVNGLSASVVKLLALEHPQDHAEPQMPDCVFGWAVSQTALSFSTIAFIAVTFSRARPTAWRVAIHAFQLVVRGPPLGSRAPPALFL